MTSYGGSRKSAGGGGVVDFVQSYNTQIDEAMEVSDEFKESVKEPMTRVFEKSLGMTDEQLGLSCLEKTLLPKPRQLLP